MKPVVSTRTRSLAPLVSMLLGLLVILSFVSVYLFSARALVGERGYRFDIYPRYVGTQAFWSGESPYSQAVTERIQLGMYGQLQPPDADQQRFAHPATSAVLLAPLILLPSEVAIPLWMTLQIFALAATPFVWFAILGWRPRPLTAVLLVLALVFVYRYPGLTYVWGQFTGTIVLLISLAVVCWQRGRDTWAGVALALATVPPSTSGPLVVLLLLPFLAVGRWRALVAFATILGAAGLFSLARIGWWLPDFLAGLNDYTVYAHPVWALDYLPTWARPVTIGLLLGLLAYSGWHARTTLRQGVVEHGVFIYVGVCIIVCLLLLPQTGSYYLVLGIPVLTMTAWRVRSLGRRAWATMVLSIGTVASPWLWVALGWPDVETLVTPLLLAVTGAASLLAERPRYPTAS